MPVASAVHCKAKGTEFINPLNYPNCLGKRIYDTNGNMMAISNPVVLAPTRVLVHIKKKEAGGE